MKLRSQIAAEQEKILSEKDQVIEKMQNEISSMKGNLKQKEEEVYCDVLWVYLLVPRHDCKILMKNLYKLISHK